MRYPVLLPRIWLLVAVFQGSPSSGRRHHGAESLSLGSSGGFVGDERRQTPEDARRRLGDVVPPTMLKFYADQETRGARGPNTVVRSFHDQGQHHHQYSLSSAASAGSVKTRVGTSAHAVRRCADACFYRATLCVSAVFAVARCLPVRLSRWWIVSTRLKISSNFFLGPVAPSF